MPGYSPDRSYTNPDPTTLTWASPHAPIEFLVIVFVLVLVLVAWYALRSCDCDGD